MEDEIPKRTRSRAEGQIFLCPVKQGCRVKDPRWDGLFVLRGPVLLYLEAFDDLVGAGVDDDD